MKQSFIICLIFFLIFPSTTQAEKKPAGNGIYWELSEDGVLTISGEGEMSNYSFGSSPWNNKDIKTLIIEEGITSIGDCAFSKCGFTTAILPQTMEHIGMDAFNQCPNLSNIVIPNNVKSIGERAFLGCKELTSVKLSNSLQSINIDVFATCSKLSSVIIPNSVVSICADAFLRCNIKSIVIPNSVKHIGKCAFKSNNPTSLFIPNSVIFIGEEAFTQDIHEHQLSYNNDKLYDRRILLLPDSLLQLHPEEWKKCGFSEYSINAYKNNTHKYKEASVLTFEKDQNDLSLLDKNNLYFYIIEERGNKGLVDKNGKWIVPINCSKYTNFYSEDGDFIKAECNNHYSLLTLNGQEIIPISRGYTSIKSVKKGNKKYFIVSKDGRYGLIDYNGNVIVPTEMDALESAGTGYIRYKLNGSWGLMNIHGKVIIDTSRGYTSIGDYKSFNKRFAYTMNGFRGECDATGRQISKIKVETPRSSSSSSSLSTTTTSSTKKSSSGSSSSSSSSSNSSNSGSSTTTVVVEQHGPIQVWVACGGCQFSPGRCSYCNGSGWGYNNRLCSRCGGNGKCTICGGTGGHYEVQYR